MPEQYKAQRVLSCFDILSEGVPPPEGGNRAVLVDDGTGFWWTYGVAESLVDNGWQLIVVSPTTTVPNNIPGESVSGLLARLGQAGTQYRVLSVLTDVGSGSVELTNVTSGDPEVLAADLVVLQTGRVVAVSPAQSFRAAGIETFEIGDCVAPRRMSNAIYEGYGVACRL